MVIYCNVLQPLTSSWLASSYSSSVSTLRNCTSPWYSTASWRATPACQRTGNGKGRGRRRKLQVKTRMTSSLAVIPGSKFLTKQLLDFHSTSCRERVRGFKNPKTPPINLPFLALVPEGCTVHTKWRRSRSQWALTFRRQEDCPALMRLPSSAQERKYNSDNSIVLTCRGQV